MRLSISKKHTVLSKVFPNIPASFSICFAIFLFSVFSLSSAFFLPTAFVFAQTSPTPTIDQYLEQNGYGTPTPPAGFSETPINVEMTPETPGPQQSVTIDVSSYSTDLTRATIAWYVNGTLVEQGIGKEELTTTTGKLGMETTISIVVNTAEGNTTEQNITIIPASLDLIWQADSYTPPFYEGKALYPNQGMVTIEAMPTFITPGGVEISAKNLVYTWKKNGSVIQSDSGYGMQSIQIQDPIPEGSTVIEADVSSVDNTISATQQVTISPTEPQVEFYDNDPLLGILYNQSLSGNFAFNGTEMTITAVPYFFSTNDPGQNLSWNWELNNNPVTGQNGGSIILRNENDQAGQSSLAVSVNHLMYEFQNASANLSISFGAASSNAPAVF